MALFFYLRKEPYNVIRIRQRGNFNRTERFFNTIMGRSYLNILDKYGQKGVELLSSATPVRTGKTASSWSYIIESDNGRSTISWVNSNVNDGVNIAVILQYGHGTGNGGYVKGIDYINPAMKPMFEELANEAWREVEKA